jgi:hypothetical protein
MPPPKALIPDVRDSIFRHARACAGLCRPTTSLLLDCSQDVDSQDDARRVNQRNVPPVFFVTSVTILAATASIS